MSVLTIDVHVEAVGTVVVRPGGEIDAENAPELREVVTARLATQPAPAAIKIDLSEVGFIDSVGIGALVACFHAAAASGVALTVVNPTSYVHRILYISGLLGLFGSPAVATAAHRGPVPPAARIQADAAY
jgi:anti-anti-sigma factor